MGKTFRGNDRHGNFRKYEGGKMKGKRKDKFEIPEQDKNKDWKKHTSDSYEQEYIPNFYDMNIR
jgi:hypothetical protein